MSTPIRPRPRLRRLTLGTLVVLSLGALAFRAPPAERCRVLAELPLWSAGAGPHFALRQLQCPEGESVEVCQAGVCRADSCGDAAAGEQGPDVWFEAPHRLPHGTGAQDVLIVRRSGQGAYPQIFWHRVHEGRPVCSEVGGLDDMLGAVAPHLAPDEHLALAGAQVEVRGATLLLTQGIFRSADPNCCPSGGALEVRGTLRAGVFHPRRIRRLDAPPSPPGLRGSYL